MEQVHASLHEVTEDPITVLINRKLLKIPSMKLEAIVDCVASDNATNDDSCKSRSTIQDGFIVTGEIRKILRWKRH